MEISRPASAGGVNKVATMGSTRQRREGVDQDAAAFFVALTSRPL